MAYWRPIAMTDPARPAGALPLAGGWCWFDRVATWERGGPRRILPATDLPEALRDRLCSPRADLAGMSLGRVQIMAILNVTPDSFSDGGRFLDPSVAVARGHELMAAGADILDLGGESTRPGAEDVPELVEIERTAPVIRALNLPVSIDTRKAAVAEAAVAAGAVLVNDVTGLTFDPQMLATVARSGAALCIMHSRGTPGSMTGLTEYEDLLADVYDWLEAQVAQAEAAGIPRARILVDPGIGFAKTAEQNLQLIRGLSLFHGLGCGILLGVSRKRFIGTYGAEPQPDRRAPGSIAAALAGIAQGAQVIRVHDVAETRQAVSIWNALTGSAA